MTSIYPMQFVGVADGTVPQAMADGRQVGAHVREVLAVKDVTAAQWAVGDLVYLGKKRAGETLVGVTINADTTLGTTTLSVGPLATPAKYVNAKTNTAIDTPTGLGPKASTLVGAPATANEDIWMTIGVAAIPAAVNLSVILRFLGA